MPVFQLTEDIIFPSPDLAEPNGLLAVDGDLSPARLLTAYRAGIFPWYSPGEPILWWSPAPRLVLFPGEFHLSRRVARIIRQNYFSVSADSSFQKVITTCAAIRRKKGEGTWITPEMLRAYCHLHELGFAHSIECWRDGRLVGGLYGVCLDRVFFGESMFSLETNASKVALAFLVEHAKTGAIELIDCQMTTQHLLSLGARELSRTFFQNHLRDYIKEIKPQKKWRLS